MWMEERERLEVMWGGVCRGEGMGRWRKRRKEPGGMAASDAEKV